MKILALLTVLTLLTGCPEAAPTTTETAAVTDTETDKETKAKKDKEAKDKKDKEDSDNEEIAEEDGLSEDEHTDVTTTTTAPAATPAAPAATPAAPAPVAVTTPAPVVLTNAALALSKTSHGYGSKDLGTTTTQTITITNSGDKKATSLAFTGLIAPFTATTTNCGTEIAGKGSCTISVAYMPTAAGDHAGALTLAYNNGSTSLTTTNLSLGLTGKGLTIASLAYSTTSYSFEAKDLGSSTAHTITLTNSGETKTTISFAGLAAPFTHTTTCGTELAASSNCNIIITYAPTTIGNHTDALNLSYGTTIKALSLSGSVTPTISAISPTSGIGGQTLTITGTNFSSTMSLAVGSNTCNYGSNTTTQLTCTIPTNSAGAQTVTISENSKSATYTSFTYLALASLALDVSSHDYTNIKVDVTKMQSFTLTNSGGVQATTLAFSGLAAPYSKTGGTCGTTLAAGATCTVELTFSPTAISANQTDELKVDYNNGSAAATQLNLNLSGNGTDRVVDVEASSYTTFLRYKSGLIKSVGNNYYGKLGIGDTNNVHYTTFQTTTITDAKALSAGENTSCVIHNDDTVSCWGRPYLPTVSTVYASPQSTGESGTQISSGQGALIAILQTNGSGRAYGRGTEGQLGDDTFGNANGGNFVNVANTGTGNTVVTQFASGTLHLVALDNAGNVWSTGDNGSKQIGTTFTSTDYKVSTQISGLSNITQVGAGASHSAALDSSGKVWVWGEGSYGTKGNNTTTDIETPIEATNGVTKMSVGAYHICVIKTDKSVRCWGNASFGQLGNNDDNSAWNQTPQNPGLANVLDIDCGFYHTTAVTEDGKVYTWGDNGAGQLGLNDKVKRLVPVEVSGM